MAILTTDARTTRIPSFAGAGNLIYRSADVPRFVSGQGCFLRTADGRSYLDAEAANGTLAWGYDSELLREALNRCMELPALPSFCESDLRLAVLERIERLCSEALGTPGRVELDLGGAQGMETALRIAFSNNGPGTVMVFEGAFHGRSGVTSMLSSSPRYRELLAAWGLEVVRLPSPDCLRCPHADTSGDCSTGCARAVTRWGSETSGVGGRAHARKVSAFIFESVQNVGGMVTPDPALLRAAVEHARAQGAVIIADEIFTGMHRVGPRWGFQRAGVRPDIVVTSKALTNGGAAVSAVWAREPLASPEHYPPGSHSATFVGIPHALAVVDTVLDRWEAWEDVERDVRTLEAGLDTRLQQLADRYPGLIKRHDAMGATARIVLTGGHAARIRQLSSHVHPDHGLLVASTGMAPDVINIHPPLVTGESELDLLADILGLAFRALESETGDGPGRNRP
ncbi:aminotransferase class III-fold pyridoxal phosphate-dependent enzyme [Streptomyces monomycini]|uniref:aminotransferase class III-fold pyridoxal phosphate-dependent enzyme n=1 Tax=Streptomyces monomycini TaxID=371720 RepID=UPI0004ABCD2E|nr:aminotransferase class III-fold pyridoxal phosphate-dependent enzyme [Streptomyces monomycini]